MTKSINRMADGIRSTMARYLHPEVERIRAEPDPDEDIRLVLMVREDSIEQISERVANHSGEVKRQLSAGRLIVTIPEIEVGSLCTPDSIKSVSLDEGMEVLSSGNR